MPNTDLTNTDLAVTGPTITKLTLDDIADLRAYERTRTEFRRQIMALKRLRRISVGPVVTLVFENRRTILYQIQEMARAERILSDEGIQAELDTYNPLIPSPGQLSATLFIELTSREEMEHWLPRLVGVERSVELIIGDGPGAEVVRCTVEADHASQLTREEITASVHYIRFELTAEAISRFGAEPVAVAIDHPEYHEQTQLGPESRASLLEDLG